MVQSDILIACVNRSFGGAYKTYTHAVKTGKSIYNIALDHI